MFVPFKETILKIINPIFSPLLSLPPIISVTIISFVATLVITLVSRSLQQTEEMKKMKKKSKELKERMIKAQKEGKQSEIEKILNEMMDLNKIAMKNSLKVMLVSTLIALFILPWLSANYTGKTILALPIKLPIIGNSIGWLLWYIFVGTIFSFILNKIFEVKA